MAALTIRGIVQSQHSRTLRSTQGGSNIHPDGSGKGPTHKTTEAYDMAFATTTTRAPGFGLRDRLATLMQSYQAGAARRRVYRQTIAELSALSDRDLADLGLHRALIRRVALEAANAK